MEIIAISAGVLEGSLIAPSGSSLFCSSLVREQLQNKQILYNDTLNRQQVCLPSE